MDCLTCRHLGNRCNALNSNLQHTREAHLDLALVENCLYYRARPPRVVWLVLHNDEPAGVYLHESAARRALNGIKRDYTVKQWEQNPCARIVKTELDFER